MQIIFKHKDLEVTDSIKDYAISKFESLQNHVKENNSSLEIEIAKNSNAHKHGQHYQISTNIIINKNKVFIETVNDDLYSAIDILREKVMENISQRSDKIRTKERSLWRKIKDKLKSREKYDDDGMAGEFGNE